MLSKNEIIQYLEGKDDNQLYSNAVETRRQVFGNVVYLRGIIEFSSVCKKDCLYCGLRKSNREIKRYRMPGAEVVSLAERAWNLGQGINTVVLQSGEDDYYSPEMIAGVIREIKSRTGLMITLSLGEKSEKDYQLWKAAGADRYLLKMESMDREIYEKMRPGCIFENRLSCLENLKKIGYEAGSGVIIGLPGQTVEKLADDLLKLSLLNLEMIGCGPFIPHQKTPLSDVCSGDYLLALRVISLLRLLNPGANLPATSAIVTMRREGRKTAIQAGANVVMPSLTPARNRKLYEIYPGKNIECDCVIEGLEEIMAEICEAGCTVGDGPGNARISKEAQ